MISNFPEEFNTATGRPPPRPPITATTAIPISVTTTTRRPPRVKSNILANKKPSKSSFPFSNQRNKKPTVRPEVPIEFTLTDITDDRSKDPFRNPPLISADGKKPRVKSNLNFKHQNNFGGQGNNNNNNGGGGGFHVEKPGLKASKKVPFDQNQFNFVPPAFEDQVLDYEVDLGGGNNINSNPGPEVRPDGRSPRVKSNIEALRKNQGRKVVNSPVRDTTESIFNLIPTGRPPLLTSRAPPPLAPAPTVEPTREEINQFSNFPPSFNSGQRPAGSPPRVKSNLNNANRNRPSFNNVVPQNELPGALGGVNRFPTSRPEPPPAFRQPPVTTPSPTFSSTLLSIFDGGRGRPRGQERPTFIDEIDEIEEIERPTTPAPPPQFFSSTSTAAPPPTQRPRRPQISTQRPRPPRPTPTRRVVKRPRTKKPTSRPTFSTPRPNRTRPRVKSNILASGRGKKRNRFKEKERSKSTRNKVKFNDNNINFVNNEISQDSVSENSVKLLYILYTNFVKLCETTF